MAGTHSAANWRADCFCTYCPGISIEFLATAHRTTRHHFIFTLGDGRNRSKHKDALVAIATNFCTPYASNHDSNRTTRNRDLGENYKLNELRKNAPPTPVKNYEFKTLGGTVSLLDLFAGKTKLFAIHNMGQGCRYCTLWADGLNPFVPHLESEFATVLLSRASLVHL